MKENTKFVIAGVGAGILVIALIAFWPKTASQPVSSQPQTPTTANQQLPTAGDSALAGTLKKTNDVERGNLMLVTSDKIIYLNTTRDFSALVDKEVKVTIEGTLESFRLLDIAAK